MFRNRAYFKKYGHVRCWTPRAALVCLTWVSACVEPLPDDAKQPGQGMGTGGALQDAGAVGTGGNVGTGGHVGGGGNIGTGGNIGGGGRFGGGGNGASGGFPGSGGFPSGGMAGMPPGALPISPFEVSRRLSLFLWGSNAAMVNPANVTSVEQIRQTARSMVTSGPSRMQLAKFYRWWLKLQTLDGIQISDSAFSPMVRQAMADEPIEFALRATAARGTFADLVLPGVINVPPALADLYGTPAGLQRPAMRAGLLTMPGVLAMGTFMTRTSPVARAQFILERMLCQPVPAPPASVDTTVPPQSEWNGRSLREELGTLITDPACVGCHRQLDNVGFLYEKFDLLGRLRATDNGRTIDDSGTFRDRSINGPQDMAMLLSGDPHVRRCFVDHWLQFARTEALARSPSNEALWEASVEAANEWAARNNHSLVEVIVGVATSPIFLAP